MLRETRQGHTVTRRSLFPAHLWPGPLQAQQGPWTLWQTGWCFLLSTANLGPGCQTFPTCGLMAEA